MASKASARAAVDGRGDGNDEPRPRGSGLYQSVVDAVVSEHEDDDKDRRRRRHRLSLEDERTIRKTSLLLTRPTLLELVHSHREKTRLERLKDKYCPLPSSTPPRISETLTISVNTTTTNRETTRCWLRRQLKTRRFRAALYSVVLADVVALALDEGTGDRLTAFNAIDIVCTLLFIVEVFAKSTALGWFHGRDAFFAPKRRLVRLLNVLLLTLSLLSYALAYEWRILRGLKTVRCLTLYAGLRRILRSLARAIPFLANVATLALFFLFAFSIFGLEAYKGTFDQQCKWDSPVPANNESFWTALPRMYCSTNATCFAPSACGAVPPPSATVNFDSGLSALFLVFLVVAQDGWVSDIMEPVVEATSRFSALFFVAIVASMVFLVVNLFVAVITTSFMNFSVESSRERDVATGKGGGEATPTNGEGEEDDDDGVTCRGAMIKMDPLEEATRVSLIMGATLAIEESIQQQQPAAATDEPPSPTTFARLLARTHKFHSLHDLTADATRELIQHPSSVDELLLATSKRASGSPEAIPEHESIRHDDASPPARAKASPSLPTKADPAWFLSFQRVVLSKRFDDFFTACIVANTAFLLVEYRNMPAWVKTMLSVAEYLFGGLFFAEMVARMVALRGVRTYLRSTERFFDLVVVLGTSANMVLNNMPNVSFSSLNSISSLRTLRVSRLMLKWEGTRKLIESVLKSSRGVMDVVVFLILFQVVASILAMQLFGGSHMASDGETPRWNFDTFPRSFLTLLQVITADQWSSITYDAVNADDPHVLLVPFLIVIFIIGQYVLLNLFIAVILENFSISEEEAYQLQLEQIIAIPKELDIYEKIEEEGVRAFGEMEQLDNVSNVKLRMFLGLDADAREDNEGEKGSYDGRSGERSGLFASLSSMGKHQRPRHRAAKPPASGFVMLARRCCQRFVRHMAFRRLVQLMILVSCVTLMLDDPHPEIQSEPPSDTWVFALSVCNRVALGVFVVEFMAKVGAFGFGLEYLKVQLLHRDEALGYVPKQSYIEDRWNQLDLFLLVLTVADEAISHASDSVSAARMFRAGRVLRPLRILNHHHEMKLILSAVAQSLPHVGNVFGLCAIVYVIFGVLGRSFFSGLFFSCNDASVATEDECVGFFTVEPDGALALQEATAKSVQSGEILVPRVWQNARFSFDNIGAAFLALLEMTSLKWIDKTFAAMDIRGAGRQPEQDHAPYYAVFFILFVYIGSLFVIRLFVGVLVEQFQRNNGTQILTESQKSWVDLEKFVLLLKPLKRIPRPRTALQNKLYDLCQHRYFGRAIAAAILLNVALLLFNNAGDASTTETASFQVIEMLFLAVFLTEATLKCLAFRHHYVLTSTGAFELLILGGSLAAYSLSTGIHGLIQAGRIFRVMRVLRFVRLNRGVYAVFQTFRASIKPIGHIFFLLFMIFFIFAVVGRQLFGGVRLGPSLNRFSNFRSFSSSFLLLFQIMAGDDWHLTMTDCMLAKPFCVERSNPDTGKFESDCGSPVAAVLFFVTYVTLVVFFLLNLFIAVVLENFRSCYLQDDVCPISLQDFESYREVFMEYDVHNTGAFPLWQLASFLADLPPGLRVDRKHHRMAFLQLRSQAQALLESWQQQRCKRPFFNELLRMLCIHQLGIRCLPYEQQRDRVKQIFIYRAKVADMLVESTVKGYVQRWRLRRERAKLDSMRRKMVPETAAVHELERSVTRRASGGVGDNLDVLEAIKSEHRTRTQQSGEMVVVSAAMTVTTSDEQQGVGEEVEGRVRRMTATSVVADAILTAMAGPAKEEPALESDEATPSDKHHRHHHHHHHHRHHHKHKKQRHKDKRDVVIPDNSGELVAKSVVDEPLHAPRRLPKMAHKVVPTG